MLFKKHMPTYFLLCMIFLTLLVFKASATPAVVAVNPPASSVTYPAAFNVTINVTNIYNFTAYQFYLYYLNSILSCKNASDGGFLSSGGAGIYFGKTITNNYNATHGRLLAYCSLEGNNTVNGSGVLTIITFQPVAGGDTPLHLAGIKLGDEKIPPEPIPYTSVDGSVHVTGPAPIDDVAITQLTSPKKVICQTYTGNVTTTLANLGNLPENVNVTLYANMTAFINGTATSKKTKIGNFMNVPIITETSVNLTLVWDTTGLEKGNYTLIACADPVRGETNTENNNFTDRWVMVTRVGDVQYDDKCDGRDLIILSRAFGSYGPDYFYPGSPATQGWNPDADITNDDKVDGRDLLIASRHFGEGM